MNRLIDADELEKDGWCVCRTVQIDGNTMEFQARKPTDFPAIEPRKTGKWIRINNEPFADTFECSECGQEPPIRDFEWHLSDYCPNCGADMREGGQDG